MLGKLMKHEFRATARTFLPVYGATIIVALFTRFMMIFQDHQFADTTVYNMFITISILLFSLLLMASSILTLTVMISRFYKNLLGDQGYLMLTLPVKPWQHIISKLVVSFAWMIGSAIIGVVSFVILMSQPGMLADIMDAFRQIFVMISQYINLNYFIIGLEVIVLMISSMAFATLEIYFAIALGHRSSKNRVAAGFGWYILINIVLQILLTIIMTTFPDISVWFNSATATLHAALWLSIVGTLIPTAFFFWGTNKILNTKLNLE